MSDAYLSDDAEQAMRRLASRAKLGEVLDVSDVGRAALNELCDAGLVELTIDEGVTVGLSPRGRSYAVRFER
jgi:hypothetical protein